MQPLVVIDGEFSASLDGMTLAGDRLVEIKCPFKGRESTLWQSVQDRRLPEHYQLASHAKERGGGISVTRCWKRGNIDYKRVPALATVDLEQYRGPAREETRVQID